MTFNITTPLAEDCISAPASQAYVEWIFLLCGMFCSGYQNSMLKSRERRSCLKLYENELLNLLTLAL